MERLEAVAWVFPDDDAQTNTAFCAVECCLSFWAKPAPSLVCESWEVIHLIMADINHGSWGCWPLYASGGAVHILLPSLGRPSLLLSTVDKGICNLQPEYLELFVLLASWRYSSHPLFMAISAICQKRHRYHWWDFAVVRYKATIMPASQLLPCGLLTPKEAGSPPLAAMMFSDQADETMKDSLNQIM